MSRTKRKCRKGYRPSRIEEGGDAKVDRYGNKKKMRPYTKEKSPMKFYAERFDGGTGYNKATTSYEKLITRNANRSLKKGLRQLLKKQLKDELRQYKGHSGSHQERSEQNRDVQGSDVNTGSSS